MAIITYREAISGALREALQSDPKVFLMGEDIGDYGGSYAVTKGFIKEFGPQRIRDMPIAESVIVGTGIGAAMAGMRPIVELMTINFSLLALDQIVNIASKIHYMSGGQVSVPLVIRTVSGGGNQLAATHSQSLEGWFACLPGLRVAVPATPYDARGLMRTALKDKNPTIFVEHSLLYSLKGEVPDEWYTVPFGKAEVKRPGKDVTIVSYLRMTQVALRAAERLAQEHGIQAEVVDLRTLRPLDVETAVESVKKTNKCVVVEETWRTGGFGAEIVGRIQEAAFDSLDGPVMRVAGKDVPMPYSRKLELTAIPNEDDIIRAVKVPA
ncbi:MAG: alpha-ketoacid dehydrogenase subunit beta [Dehalococcoidia bacterium]|nr:alpha-ketoacid dehydrogenase subunit beta [Dehalococcoidia bacterium]